MVINILTEIGGSGFTHKALAALLEANPTGDIELNVASPGGDVAEADIIYSELIKAKKAGRKIYAYLLGEVASAASYIIMAADEIVAMPQARIMIHNAWGQTAGNATNLRATAERFDRIDKSIAAIYAAKTNHTETDLLQMMEAETWMTAEEAKTLGFVDRIESTNAKAIEFGKVYAYLAPEIQPIQNNSKPKKMNGFLKTMAKAMNLLSPEKAKNVYDELADGTVIFGESEDGDWTDKSVFSESAEGEMMPLADNTYDLRDGRKIRVEGGVIKEVMAAMASDMEKENEELKNKVTELTNQLTEAMGAVNALTEKVQALTTPIVNKVQNRTQAPVTKVQNKVVEKEGVQINPAYFEEKYGKKYDQVLEMKSKLVNK